MIGVDPGLKGGFALLDCYSEKIISAQATPVVCESDGRNTYDLPRMFHEVSGLVNLCKALGTKSSTWAFCIERQQAMPQQGVVSMFTTGYGYGIWRTMAAVLGCAGQDKLIIVRSLEWQTLLRGEDARDETKAKSIARVKRLFPSVDLTPGKKRTPSDGIADAVNIAHYAFLRMAKP